MQEGQTEYKGRFKAGYDPRRHRFTTEDCRKGFAAAEASLARRFPDVDVHFMMCALIGSKPWHTLPQFKDLLNRDEPVSEAEMIARFSRE